MNPKTIKDYINEHLINNIDGSSKQKKLYKHQEDIIDKLLENPKYLPIVNGRQMGLSTVINLFSIAYCKLENNKKIIIVVRNHNEIVKIISESYDISIPVDVIKKQEKTITFSNGSEIIIKNSSNPDSFRGLSADYVFLTDFSFLQNPWETFLTAELITPTIVIQSCADHSGSLFHLICKFSNNTMKIINEQTQYIDEKYIDEIRKNLSEKQFRQEYLCSFVEKSEEKDSLMNLRVSSEEKNEIAKNAEKYGFKNVSEYLRVVALDRTLLNRLDRQPERAVFQVDTGKNIDNEERKEYIKTRLKELTNNITSDNRTWINVYKAELILLENKKHDNSLCRQYLFGIGSSKSELDPKITSLVSKIDIDEEKVIITYFIDEYNTVENYLKEIKKFFIIWLDRTGEPVGSLEVPNNIEKMFPIGFSHEGPGSVLGKIIIKR